MEAKADSLDAYVDCAVMMLDLPIAAEHRPGVIDNLTRIQEIAKRVTEFPLPEDIEVAPIFQP